MRTFSGRTERGERVDSSRAEEDDRGRRAACALCSHPATAPHAPVHRPVEAGERARGVEVERFMTFKGFESNANGRCHLHFLLSDLFSGIQTALERPISGRSRAPTRPLYTYHQPTESREWTIMLRAHASPNAIISLPALAYQYMYGS